jgi:pimeloyl-ACP methyl ester carboxylesterase
MRPPDDPSRRREEPLPDKTVALLAVLPLLLAGCLTVRPYREVRQTLPAERFVTWNGHPVYVEQQGQGEPVVLIHGFGSSSYEWREVAPALAGSYRVIALDLFGFGYTERPRDAASYTREGQAAMILGVLDQLGIQSAHLVGHSYGGALALYIAATAPERVKSLILADSAAPTYPTDRRSRTASWRWTNRLFLGLTLRPWFIRRGLRAAYFDDGLVTPQVVAAYLDRLRIEGIEAAYRGLTAPAPPSPLRVDLTQIDRPTLVIWGAEDRTVALKDGRRFAELIPGARMVVLEKTGHVPMEESPAAFVGAALPFLKAQG